MRITKKQLKRIIKEETKAIVDEGWWPFGKKEADPESEPCEDDFKCENGRCVPKPFYARENKVNKTDLQKIIKEAIQEEKSFLLSTPKK